MSDFTPDELERYKEWAESLKGPQMSSLDEALEAQREAQAVAELTARGAKGAEKQLATLGEVAEKLKDVKVKLPLTNASQEAGLNLSKDITEDFIKKQPLSNKIAEESAQVFEEAGSALPKNIAEGIVKDASKGGKNARRAAAKAALSQTKELPALSDYATTRERKLYDALIKQAEAEIGTIGKNAIEMAGEVVPDEMPKNLPAVIPNQNTLPAKLPTKTQANLGDIIETTGRTIGSIPEPSRFSKLSKFLPSLQSLGKGATALGAAASAYDFSQGNLVEGGLTALETLLGNAAPRAAAPLELLRPTATVSQEEEQAELDALRRSNLLASLQKRGLAEESVGSGEQLALKRSRLDYNVPETPTPLLPVSEQSDYTVPERPTPLLPTEVESVVAEASRPQPLIKPTAYTEKPSTSPSVAPSPTPVAAETKPDTTLVQEEPSSRSRLEDALELQRQYELMAAISRGSEMMGRGIAGAISKTAPSKMSDGEFEKALSALGKQKVEGAKLLEEQNKKQQELDRAKRKRDPNSPESKYIRDYFAQLGLSFPETASAEIVEKFIPQTTAILNQREVSARLERQSKEKAQDRILLAREKAKEEQTEAITKSEEKREKIISQEKEKLEKRLAEPAQALLAITDFEMNLKNKYLNDPNFSLDDFDIKKFKGDLPGTNVPGYGRVSFYDSDARQLQRDIDTVLNQMIRAFAGKAVTKNELERIKSQFSSGAFNTAPEMIDAMAKAKKIARQGMKSSEAAFSKEAVQNFKEFGGITSDYGVKKKVIRKGYNRKTNQTQLIYEDGTKEVVEGEI
jgi:hypothetical protein